MSSKSAMDMMYTVPTYLEEYTLSDEFLRRVTYFEPHKQLAQLDNLQVPAWLNAHTHNNGPIRYGGFSTVPTEHSFVRLTHPNNSMVFYINSKTEYNTIGGPLTRHFMITLSQSADGHVYKAIQFLEDTLMFTTIPKHELINLLSKFTSADYREIVSLSTIFGVDLWQSAAIDIWIKATRHIHFIPPQNDEENIDIDETANELGFLSL